MKINKIHIIAFGGLKNYSLDFTDGFNCIYGENENGKTTIMSFIKMMFYGSERGSSQISKNIRKKYTPWDGTPMAGSLEFEENGRKYRLEREFRSSNSTDKVSLTDLSLGEKQPVDSDIGVKLYGLSAAAFERSIFIGQFGFPDSDTAAESEINARLSNMVSTGDEEISLDTVKSRLEKARFSLISKSGKTGAYYKNYQTANEIKQKLDSALQAQKRYLDGKEKLVQYKKETNALLLKAEALKQSLSAEQDIKNASKLKEYIDTKTELEEIKKEFILKDGAFADENYQRSLKFCIAKTDSLKSKISAKENEAQIIKNQIEAMINAPRLSSDETPDTIAENLVSLDNSLTELNGKIRETEKAINDKKNSIANNKNSHKKFNPALLALSISLLAVCVITAILNLIAPAIISAILGVILLCLGFVIRPNDTKRINLIMDELNSLESVLQTQVSHADEIKGQISSKKARLEAINLSINTNNSVIETSKNQLADYENQIATLKSEQANAQEELNSILQKLNFSFDSDLDTLLEQLQKNIENQKELKQKINLLLKDLNNISFEDAKLKLSQIESSNMDLSADFERLKAEYENLISNITERKAMEASALTELKGIISGVENPDTLEKQLQECVKNMESQKSFCDSADIALEVLTDSFAELRQNYGSQLEKKSAEIFSLLTGGKYSNMTISKSFGINVEEDAKPISRESDYLSSGTVDQAYLSLRLAISKLISEGKSLPIFLDDTLAQYDDTRAKKALEFLNEYAKASQMIMFTCHKSISDYSGELGGNIKILSK